MYMYKVDMSLIDYTHNFVRFNIYLFLLFHSDCLQFISYTLSQNIGTMQQNRKYIIKYFICFTKEELPKTKLPLKPTNSKVPFCDEKNDTNTQTSEPADISEGNEIEMTNAINKAFVVCVENIDETIDENIVCCVIVFIFL